MKTIVLRLLLAVLVITAGILFVIARPSSKPNFIHYRPDGVSFAHMSHDKITDWLFLTLRGNAGEYDPLRTSLVSDHAPVIRKLDNGNWQITFTSEVDER